MGRVVGLGCRVFGVGAKGATITSSAALLVVVVAAIKFPVHLEKAWLLASMLGFALDVGIYHTFSLFVRSVMKLLVGGRASARVSMHAGSSPWGLTASVCHVSCFVWASVTAGTLRVRSFCLFVPRAVDFFPLFVGLIP